MNEGGMNRGGEAEAATTTPEAATTTPEAATTAPEAGITTADPELFFGTHVFCCLNERAPDDPRGCCRAKGSEALRDYMKARAKELRLRRVRINVAGCLDRCELGPSMVIYPEGVWYHYRSREDVDEILETHLMRGGRVRRLMLQPRDREPPAD